MNLLKAASSVSLLTLLSRITGLVRDSLMAHLFGASALTDAFLLAFRIPNLLRRLFAEGAFSQAFVPLLAAERATHGDEQTHALVNAVATVLAWSLLLTCAVGIVGAPAFVAVMGPGLHKTPGATELAVSLTRWMFPYIGFMSLVALSAGVLNTWKRFWVAAATPVLLNVSVVLLTWLLAPKMPAWGLNPLYAQAAGVMVGGMLQLAVQVPALARIGMIPRIAMTPGGIRAAWRFEGVRKVLRLMGPAVLGVSVAQVSLIINTAVATLVSPGAPTWLAYADRLMEFPTGLLGVALGVVLTPSLSAQQAKGDTDGYSRTLDWGLRMVVMLALPCAAALLVFAEPLVAALFHNGRFTDQDVRQTALAVMAYGVGLVGIVSVKVLAPGFYAKQDIRTPVKVAVVVLVLTQCMNAVLVPWMGHPALSLTLGLGASVNALWLLVSLRRRGSYRPEPGWLKFVGQLVLASLAMAAFLWYAQMPVDWMALKGHWFKRTGLLLATVAAAIAVYFSVLALSGVRLRAFMKRA
ncbi:MAG: murein biosynthesis integral membrane protein MurJ [Burkholderiaceae bacterium]|nr:MAG: murein biosynthesis integral membrane protein MurJ [Burkholderiaceae bacterium]